MQTRSKHNWLALRVSRGFSVLELMIAVTLLGILVSLAIPSFQAISNINRLSGTSNELLTAMQVARMESIRRGVRVVVCKSTNPDSGAAATCTTTAGNWTGWIAFVDDGAGVVANANNGVRDANEFVLRVTSVTAPIVVVPSPAISGASQRIAFRPDGLAKTAAGGLLTARLRVCIATGNPLQNVRDVALASGSRTSVLRATAAACPAPAN